jgi:hypothetical protein
MWFNLLHLHGEDVMFDDFRIIQWLPSTGTIVKPTFSFRGAIPVLRNCLRGLRRWETMVLGTRAGSG